MTQIVEYACKDLVFHFNRKHLEDETIPMWSIKTHGETFYVAHVSAEIPWSTKETPDNSHTKGSIKFHECLLVIDENNEAHIKVLTDVDRIRIHNQKRGITRIMFLYGSPMHKALSRNEFRHSPFKNIRGACSTAYIVCDLLKKEEVTMAGLKYTRDWRVLKPNEGYYQAYDKPGDIDEDDWSEAYVDDDDE